MTRGWQWTSFLVPASLLASLFAVELPARAQEPAPAVAPELIAEQASGIVPLKGETGLTIRGFSGKLTVWGATGEGVQFDATELATKTAVPVRVTSVEGRIVIEPPADAPPRKWVLLIYAPPKMAVSIDAADSQVEVTRADAACQITGKSLTVDLSYIDGQVTLELQGGSVRAIETAGDIVLRGKDWSAQVGPARGRLALYGGPGTAEVQGLEGGFDAEVERVRLRLSAVSSDLRVRARGGAVDVVEARSGGTFTLFGTPLSILRSGGSFDVTSDAPITFGQLKADLRVEGDGASVEGTGNSELIDVRTHDARVILSQIGAPVRVSGTGLTVQMKVIAGDVRIDTRASAIDLTSLGAKLELTNDGGDVKLASAYGETTVVSHDGTVRVTDQGGPLQLTSDGAETSVEWGVMPPGSKSAVENESGPVSMRLPTSGNGCRIEARTSSGSIESPFKRVVVSGDRSDAQGFVGTDTETVVRIRAAGDVKLSGGPPDAGGAH